MSADWNSITIDEIKSEDKGAIAIGPFGSRMKSDCYVNEGIPVIRGTNITGGPTFEGEFVFITKEKADELGSCNVYKNDLVFPHRGSIGEVGIVLKDERYVISSSLMKLTCDTKKANPKFIYYFFKSKNGRHELLKNASQVGTPGIGQPLSSLKSISLNLPPIDIQNKIADILSALDEKIYLNTQTNQTLESIAQAIFKSWFVDFEPVKAKMTVLAEGGTREQAELAAMSDISGKSEAELAQLQQQNPEHYQQIAETAALFPSAMVDSELGEIPEGWEVGTYDQIIEFNPKRSIKKGQLAPYLDMQNVPTSGHCADDVILREMNSGTKFVNGDTLLARITPCLENGKTAFVDFLNSDETGWGSTEFIIMRTKDGLPNSISYIIARQENFRSISIQSMTGTSGRQRAEAKVIGASATVIPPKELLINFGKISDKNLHLAGANHKESKTLAELRDSLLPKLLSGEIELTENKQ